MPEFDPDRLDDREKARIVKSAVNPRPIAWISTRSAEGTDNLAPFSSYNYVDSRDPMVLFNTPGEGAGGLKDTPRNALDSGEFAVNVVTEPFLEAMDHTSADVPPGESEFDLAGVERAECRRIDAPRVAAAPVTMECELYEAIEIRDRLMVVGEVVYFHVSGDAMVDGKVDSRELPTVGRLGGPYYTISDPVDFERRY